MCQYLSPHAELKSTQPVVVLTRLLTADFMWQLLSTLASKQLGLHHMTAPHGEAVDAHTVSFPGNPPYWVIAMKNLQCYKKPIPMTIWSYSRQKTNMNGSVPRACDNAACGSPRRYLLRVRYSNQSGHSGSDGTMHALMRAYLCTNQSKTTVESAPDAAAARVLAEASFCAAAKPAKCDGKLLWIDTTCWLLCGESSLPEPLQSTSGAASEPLILSADVLPPNFFENMASQAALPGLQAAQQQVQQQLPEQPLQWAPSQQAAAVQGNSQQQLTSLQLLHCPQASQTQAWLQQQFDENITVAMQPLPSEVALADPGQHWLSAGGANTAQQSANQPRGPHADNWHQFALLASEGGDRSEPNPESELLQQHLDLELEAQAAGQHLGLHPRLLEPATGTQTDNPVSDWQMHFCSTLQLPVFVDNSTAAAPLAAADFTLQQSPSPINVTEASNQNSPDTVWHIEMQCADGLLQNVDINQLLTDTNSTIQRQQQDGLSDLDCNMEVMPSAVEVIMHDVASTGAAASLNGDQVTAQEDPPSALVVATAASQFAAAVSAAGTAGTDAPMPSQDGTQSGPVQVGSRKHGRDTQSTTSKAPEIAAMMADGLAGPEHAAVKTNPSKPSSTKSLHIAQVSACKLIRGCNAAWATNCVHHYAKDVCVVVVTTYRGM